MYSRFQLLKKYLLYYLTASNGKGHGIHSPFVFNFIINVLQDKKKYECYDLIEAGRQRLLKRSAEIEVEDLGAGSGSIKTSKRVVADMARSSLKPAKYAQLMYRMVKHYQPKTIVELGTSFGITTSYLASGNAEAKIYTIEGAASIADIARETFRKLELKNIELTEGDFGHVLSSVLTRTGKIDLAFIDGNHKKIPTLEYFHQLVNLSTPSTIIIFDDIHWSMEMEEAWTAIQQDPAITLSIDLFFIGIVFFNPDINHKQHFTIRF